MKLGVKVLLKKYARQLFVGFIIDKILSRYELVIVAKGKAQNKVLVKMTIKDCLAHQSMLGFVTHLQSNGATYTIKINKV